MESIIRNIRNAALMLAVGGYFTWMGISLSRTEENATWLVYMTPWAKIFIFLMVFITFALSILLEHGDDDDESSPN